MLDEPNRIYIGLERALGEVCALVSNRPTTIELSFNTDGLPISSSGNGEFWPVLMSSNISKTLFSIVGLYYSKQGKPSAEILLRPLIDDLGIWLTEGFQYPNTSIKWRTPVILKCVSCDLPALALVKCTKCPTGYHSCTKCTIRGQRSTHGNQYFIPRNDFRIRPRTDKGFRTFAQKAQHQVAKPLKRSRGHP